MIVTPRSVSQQAVTLPAEEMAFFEDQLRAMRALNVLLESKLIDHDEYDRRAQMFGNAGV